MPQKRPPAAKKAGSKKSGPPKGAANKSGPPKGSKSGPPTGNKSGPPKGGKSGPPSGKKGGPAKGKKSGPPDMSKKRGHLSDADEANGKGEKKESFLGDAKVHCRQRQEGSRVGPC